MKRIHILFTAFILLWPVCAMADKDIITWYRAEFPPASIIHGTFKDKGHDNYLEEILKQKLKGYKHTVHHANYGRILKQLATTNCCCVTLLKTPEREKYIEYSRPTMVYLATGVIVLKSKINLISPFMDEEGYVSIEKLFKKTKLRMGISHGRRYGGMVDRIIDQNKNSPRIITHFKEDLLKSLLVKIEAEHPVDFTIGHSHELNWQVSNSNIGDNFEFIPMRETPKYILSYIGCTKNEWGKKIIRKINKILGDGIDPEYKRRYQSNLRPENVAIHDRYISEVFSSENAQTFSMNGKTEVSSKIKDKTE